MVLALGGSSFSITTGLARGASTRLREASAEAAGCASPNHAAAHQVLLVLSDGLIGDQQEVVRGAYSAVGAAVPAGVVDRFRVVIFPVITGATGAERIYDGYPDVALEMIDHRTFGGGFQLVEYRPRILEHPPLHAA